MAALAEIFFKEGLLLEFEVAMHVEAQAWVEKLGLLPHPEGGYFKESYRSDLKLPPQALPPDFRGDRAVSTAIYYLLHGEEFSALHRIFSDEVWHFHAGAPLRVEGLHPNGAREDWILHSDPGKGTPQAVVPAGAWFGARVAGIDGYSLVGCTAAPGFDFADFEMGDRSKLCQSFPQHRQWIESLTRD